MVLARRELSKHRIDRPGWVKLYEMIECCGCEEVIFRIRYWEEDWVQHDPVTDAEYMPEDVSYYPPVISRPKPSWFGDMNSQGAPLASLLDEVYSAIHSGSFRLAAMGARAALDVAMNQTVGDVGGFAQKLDALVEGALIVPNEKTILDAALDVGNAASHRGHKPKPEEMATVMDIVENLLRRIFVLPAQARKLRSKTPQRFRGRKKPT